MNGKPTRVRARRSARLGALSLLSLLAVAAACGQDDTEMTAVLRGDIAFAQGNFEEALAEYRLAVRQGAEDPLVTARVAHTYALMGRVDDAGTYYLDAIAREGDLADQAVSDLMHMALDAAARNDRFAMATAVQTALRIQPGVGVGDLTLPLARHYFQNGEYGRALPFYQKALAEASDSASDVVFEVGQAHAEIGDCEHALLFFERFRQMVRPNRRGEVDWYIGTCAFNVARELRASGARGPELQRALALIDRAVEVGEPRNIQAQAWFEKGEILAEMGECEAAMEAYAQVRYADQAGSLVDQAQAAFDQIRFGRGLEHLRDGRCR